MQASEELFATTQRVHNRLFPAYGSEDFFQILHSFRCRKLLVEIVNPIAL
jgi:hypothetical protein